MNLRNLDPTLTGAAAAAAAYVAARAFGVSKKAAAGFGAGALLVHDRMVDGLWPFRKSTPEYVDAEVVSSRPNPPGLGG